MAASNASKLVETTARAQSAKKRDGKTADKVLHGPEPIILDGEAVGSVSIVERARRRGEPDILLTERRADGTPCPVSLVGAKAAAVAFFNAPA